ncbi:hypothetical protein CEXT_758811, partial [Caerostris extrusa]
MPFRCNKAANLEGEDARRKEERSGVCKRKKVAASESRERLKFKSHHGRRVGTAGKHCTTGSTTQEALPSITR